MPDDDRILDAWWENDEFVVMSQGFERLRLSLNQLRELRFFKNSSKKALETLELDEDGAYVRWHVRRIEKGEISATVSALKKLASSHMMNVQGYLDDLAGLVEAD